MLVEGVGSLDFFSLEEEAFPDLTILLFFGGIETKPVQAPKLKNKSFMKFKLT